MSELKIAIAGASGRMGHILIEAVSNAPDAILAERYRVTLSVKKLFDRDYYAGVLSANVLPLGDPRTVMLRVVTKF